MINAELVVRAIRKGINTYDKLSHHFNIGSTKWDIHRHLAALEKSKVIVYKKYPEGWECIENYPFEEINVAPGGGTK